MSNDRISFFSALVPVLGRLDRTVVASDGRALGGADLMAGAERWAAALTGLGIGSGDRVMVQAGKSLDVVLLYLATLRLGAVYVPLNDGYRSSEIAYFLRDAEPGLFVCAPDARSEYRSIAGGVRIETLDVRGGGSLSEAVRAARGDAPPHAATARDLAAIVYTSGTTGRSKGAMITHGNLLSNARALGEAWGVSPRDRLLHALPLYHIHGLFISLNTLLLAGGRVDMIPAFNPEAVISGLARASIFMGVPTYYTRLLATPAFDRAAAEDVRLFVSGSAPLTPQTFAEFEARTGQRILERYGMSECGVLCSNPLAGPRIAGAVGPALPGVDVRIGGGGEVGVLEVKGPNVFAGYWRQPEKTRAEFTGDGYFVTGDVATIDRDGVVRIVGREKDMIISGGLNIYPKEIEELIDALPGVDESAVIGVAHPDFGEAVVAVVRARPGHDVSEAAILADLKPRIAGFKVPKAVFVVAELPRNAMGKVQKTQLRETHGSHFQ